MGDANETEIDPADNNGNGGPLAPPEAKPPAASAQGSQKNLVIPENQMKRLRAQERTKGRDGVLRELGFSSFDELKSALNAGKRAQQQAARPKPPADDEPSASKANASARGGAPARPSMDAGRLAADRAQAQKEARQAKREVEKLRAEYEIKLAAYKAGAVEPELMVIKLTRQLDTLSAEEAEAFDIDKWFTDERVKHPGYFQGDAKPVERVDPPRQEVTRKVPANTTTEGSAPTSRREGAPLREAPPPRPPTPTRIAEGSDPPADARKMSPEAFKDHLAKKHGIIL